MISDYVRFRIFTRDGFQCRYCGSKPPDVRLEIDHIHPSSRGGEDHPSNLITACAGCNRGKRAMVLPIETSETASHIISESIDPRNSLMEVAYRDPFDDLTPIRRQVERA